MTEKDNLKIMKLNETNWITWRDLMLTLLKYKNVADCLEIEGNIPANKEKSALACSFFLKQNVGPSLYYVVRNLEKPREIWTALENHFGRQSRAFIRNTKRELREITIKTCSFDVLEYLKQKADKIDSLIAVDEKIDETDMCDSILGGLEEDYRFSDFIFFYSSKEDTEYMELINRVREYANSKAFKRKYTGPKFKHKNEANFAGNPKKSYKDTECHFCRKKGHTKYYCYSNPDSKFYKGEKKKTDEKPERKNISLISDSLVGRKREVVLDSGATSHFFGERSFFLDMEECQESLRTASGNMSVTGVGTVVLETTSARLTIKGVKFVPGLHTNLLSLTALEEKSVRYVRDKNRRYLFVHEEVIARIRSENGLLKVELMPENELNSIHDALGHISFEKAKHLGIKIDSVDFYPCSICESAKGTRKGPQRKHTKLHRHLCEKFHSDICEMPVRSIDGFKYFASLIEDASRNAIVILLRKKSDLYQAVYELIEAGVFNAATLRSDQGGEYMSKLFRAMCIENNIRQEFTSTYTPEENGIAERFNRTIIEKVRSMLTQSGLGKAFWSFALLTACYVYNRCPHSSIENKIPYEERYGVRENYDRLVPFGCKASIHVPEEKRDKLDNPNHDGLMLGYVENSTEYLILDFTDRRIKKAPSTSTFKPKEFPGIERAIMDELKDIYLYQNEDGKSDDHEVNLMEKVPHDVKEAMESTEWPHWKKAIEDELAKMEKYGVYEKVNKNSISAKKRPVSTRFVFTKRFSNKTNSLVFKARLVARGYEEKCDEGHEKYSPTPEMTSLRMIMAWYVSRRKREKITMVQADVKSAFLNSKMIREVYLKPPDGIEIEENMWLKALKGIYGLVDSPKLWSDTFRRTLNSLGLEKFKSDNCLYKKMSGNTVSVMLFYYVDDIIVCGGKEEVRQVLRDLEQKFEIHLLGFPSEILGVRVTKTAVGVYLDVERKIHELLEKYEMNEAWSVKTPLPPGLILPPRSELQDEVKIDRYQSLVGSLLYLARTVRFDIYYAVNVLSRYSTKHNKTLWKYLKGILRYLKSTSDLALEYKFETFSTEIVDVWTDASFATKDNERKSSYGFIVMWNGKIVSWGSSVLKSVVTSTTEAEYVAASIAVKSGLFIRNVLGELRSADVNIVVYIDNASSKHWLENDGKTQKKKKHIDIAYRYVEDLVEQKVVSVKLVATVDQLADMMTKSLSAPKLMNAMRRLPIGFRGVLGESAVYRD